MIDEKMRNTLRGMPEYAEGTEKEKSICKIAYMLGRKDSNDNMIEFIDHVTKGGTPKEEAIKQLDREIEEACEDFNEYALMRGYIYKDDDTLGASSFNTFKQGMIRAREILEAMT